MTGLTDRNGTRVFGFSHGRSFHSKIRSYFQFSRLCVRLEFWADDADQAYHKNNPTDFCTGTVLVDSRTKVVAASALGTAEVSFTRKYSARYASQQAMLTIQLAPSGHVQKL